MVQIWDGVRGSTMINPSHHKMFLEFLKKIFLTEKNFILERISPKIFQTIKN